MRITVVGVAAVGVVWVEPQVDVASAAHQSHQRPGLVGLLASGSSAGRHVA